MLESFGPPPRAAQSPLVSLIQTTSVLRIGAGIVLMTRHAWEAILAGYQFVWKEMPWDWIPVFAKEGVPMPHLFAPAIAVVLFVVALSWITGFLTRLFSVLMLVLCLASIGFASMDYGAFSELCWLYLLISFTLTLFGSGVISLDKLFRIGSEWGKTPPHRY